MLNRDSFNVLDKILENRTRTEAFEINFDNVDTSMQETNVQNAITELDNYVGALHMLRINGV